MNKEPELFPFLNDSVEPVVFDQAGTTAILPTGCCPACKGKLTYRDIDNGPDVLVGPITEPSAEAICTACGTLYTLRYVPTSREPVMKRYPVNSLLVSLHTVMDDDNGSERVTPPGFIWQVGSIEWDDTGTLDESRGLYCKKNGAGCFATLDELDQQFLPLGDLGLLAFSHNDMWITLPHKDFGATWNDVDPREAYGFTEEVTANGRVNLVRRLPDMAGKIVISSVAPLPGDKLALKEDCPITRFNAIDQVLAQTTLGALEAAQAREEDSSLTLSQFMDKYADRDGSEHPDFPRSLWREAVANDDTLSGYWDWAHHMVTSL